MDLRYQRFLRAMVRWLFSVMVFAMFFAILADFAFQKPISMLANNDSEDSRPAGFQSSDPRLKIHD